MKTILAIDGNSIINRAYFGVRPLTNKKGQRTEAIYGMLNMILSQVEACRPDSVQVAFDVHAPTFRHKMYDGYKSGRRGMEEDLCAQMEPAENLLRALGYKVLSLAGYEADDILGTIAKKCEEEGDACYIFTGDRDSLQLISDRTTVLLVSKGQTVPYTREVFREHYGIDPAQFVDAKALMGDSSDSIPGVPGIGEKTALPLIAQFGSLEGLYERLDDPSIKSGVKTKLENGRESALLSQTLSRIYRDVPIALDFSPTERQPELYDLLSDLEFTSAIARLGVEKSAGERPAPAEEKTEYQPAPEETLLSLTGRLGVVLNDGGLYVSGEAGDFFLEAPSPGFLAAFFSNGRQAAVYDCKSLYHRLFSAGISGFEAADDPMLGAYVLCSSDKDFLPGTLADKYLSLRAAGEDARLTLRLTEAIDKRLREEGSYELYKNVELPLAFALARCEDAGFLIDRAGIAQYGEMLQICIKEAEKSIYDLAGEPFNINSPKQLGAILYDKLGLTVYGMKKTQNGYSTNAETLEKLRDVPIVGEILTYRQLSKLRSTYTEGLLKVAGEDGRVHTRFTQTVTATGRLSSIEPNLQNIPVRTEMGRELRRYFTAPAGRVLIDADYSQIELRLMAHISGDKTMRAAFENGVDIHAVTASEVFNVPIGMVTPDMRKQAKAVNFGIIYGISAFSLAGDIHVSRKEAENYIAGYFATYPEVDRWLHAEVEKAKEQGYVTTLFGRRRYIPELTSGKGQLKKFGERVAMNSPIQGSAADIIKIAMVRADRALREAKLDARLVLQVHDELIVEAAESDAAEAARILRHEMEHAAELSVPLTVDLHVGKTWYDCK